MGTFQLFMVIIIALCVILTLIVLSQSPKGGGLSSTFGGSSGGQMFGVQRTNNFLDNATWTFAALITVLIIAANVLQENPNARPRLKQTPQTQAPASPNMPIQQDTTTAPNSEAEPSK
ncbi:MULTISPECIES: preprotein translocase subunit SecG [Weeksella]|uniref:Protein-export membrane protein SecG n=1 Tax=Weeksella virosa (strain ATCC 43766 / DSM 16922 / JCM 21250 / CCUG 30538 / CDC 9751 / IAM 14551 / NBRC 16016 / NCTC 11634 / CL345/78) TaxID=865938 RepID=F0NZL9_WEEVC|nr:MULTISPECIES: preprotein translocase subunit SecG [Weeksella]ADX67278.1 preprotein translocase, SecG subunit [Weeksella virosa DSM 16922]MDK7374492.1 preprotein translocase subunit SecG [Weeksella virosa]MDK7675559.1 preprotein translocase subunit SecG [Weeksella virosa]OFM81880.1 preprotein translocase subunit SecG [Weeksella sp. HMSC059D05]SUP53559.1 preprotein translocase subunit SecG [Weeksella virosa]